MIKRNSCHWRPEGWNPKHFSLNKNDIEAFETGADAMLEALRNNYTPELICARYSDNFKGFAEFIQNMTPVWIPDEEA